ncbi:hypothetical protein [Mesorhizobium sp.]|uniref:hypothetical protein n=1 Tax=Mesorhizobium sp. TaxID=1871066 RepID=UPI000FE8243A|nr:hypothetical protein [Mesorhizobium sp.]RWB65420.1 MAG: hypothetical protein EOQ49_32190 [Mesorhizobium sp.]
MRAHLLTAVAFLIAASAAHAENCSAALTKDVDYSYTNEATKLAVLRRITKEQFDQQKQQANTGGSVEILGVPISGYGDFSNFKEAVNKESSLYQYNLDAKAEETVLTQRLSDNNLAAYVACLQNSKPVGVIMWLSNTGPFSKNAILNIQWKGPVGTQNGNLEGKFQLVGATLAPSSEIPDVWRSGETVTVILTRDVKQDAVAVIKVSGYSDNVVIPADPPVFTATDTVMSSADIHVQTDKDYISKDTCLDASAGSYFVPGSASSQVLLRVGDEGRDNTKITRQDSNHVCMKVYSSTGAVGELHQITAKLNATLRTITQTSP